MQLQDKKISYLAVFIAMASVLQVVEWLLPHPIPWLRLGLANMITLMAIITAGGSFAVQVALGRVLLSSFLLGTFLSPAFYLSFAGAIGSVLIMIAVFRPLGRLSPIGVSIVGSISHNLIQLAVAYFLLIRHSGIIFLMPPLVIAALLTGIINGWLVVKIVPAISEFALKKIYLASGSKARIEIMKKAGLPVVVIAPKIEEDRPQKGEDAKEFCLRQAERKLAAVEKNLSPPGCIITADTVVELDGEIMLKPESLSEAQCMLEKLSMRHLKVHTAIIVKNLVSQKTLKKVTTTDLKMRKLIKSDLSVAGGYAISGKRDKNIQWIKGSYTNAIGMPIEVVRKFLKKAGY